MPHEEPQYKSEEWEHLDHEQAARTTQKLRQSLDRELDRKLRKLTESWIESSANFKGDVKAGKSSATYMRTCSKSFLTA